MSRSPTPPAAEQRPIHDAREHIVNLFEPARKRMLRKHLEKKPKSEIIDAMLDMAHLPDLLDYFREDLERHNAQI